MLCTDQRREPMGDPSVWLESAIKGFCLDSPDNSLKNKENDRAWDEPLIGFSSGGDPVYQTIKEDIGPFFMTPVEVFKKSFPGTKASAEDLTVISWILLRRKSPGPTTGGRTHTLPKGGRGQKLTVKSSIQ